MKHVDSIAAFLKSIETTYRNPRALNAFENSAWRSYSTQDYLQEVKYLALALTQLGVKKGDCVGIVAPSSPKWSIADLSILAIGAVCIPLFSNISTDNFQFVVGQTKLTIAFFEGPEAWKLYEEQAALFTHPIALEEHSASTLSYSQLIAKGKQLDALHPNLFETLLQERQPEELATIIYTSGTTGTPKGVEHTHFSLMNILDTDLFQWNAETDRYLNLLPLAHVFARIVNFIMLGWGVSIYYFNDLKSIGRACQELHPTILVVVPRLLEKVYARMVAGVQHASLLKRTIGEWAFALANQEEETTWKQLFHPIAEKLVYSHLREALGGELRVVISGGAPLQPHLCHFFLDIGVPLYEGWGLTEACPLTVNTLEKRKLGTVGCIIDDLKIKRNAEGELLVKGRNVMRGYYQNPQQTARAFDEEGWLHTGDLGEIDAEGFVTITGRLKELLKTSNGKLVAPVPIESALVKAPFIEAAIVIANQRKYVTCLIIPETEVVHHLKKELHLEALSDEEFLNHTYIQEEMRTLLATLNAGLNHWEQIQAYRFIPNDLTIEKGELTPSLKIVRSAIEKRYASLIDSLYQEASS